MRANIWGLKSWKAGCDMESDNDGSSLPLKMHISIRKAKIPVSVTNSSKVFKNQLTRDRGQRLTSQRSWAIFYFLDIDLDPLAESHSSL